ITPALGQSHDEFDLVMQILGAGGIRHVADLAGQHIQDGVCRFAEEERIFAAGKTHFLRMLDIIAADAINAAYRKNLLTVLYVQCLNSWSGDDGIHFAWPSAMRLAPSTSSFLAASIPSQPLTLTHFPFSMSL